MTPWPQLKFWASGEYDVIKERLNGFKNKNILICPDRKNLFLALSLVPARRVRVAIIGQDPYPSPTDATGIAFHVGPRSTNNIPPTLTNIFDEYCSDLHYPPPKLGDLTPWCNQGVLLWNAYPSCTAGQPGSHQWPEWELLTKEIIEVLDKQICVFIFLGNKAKAFSKYVKESAYIETSHPSPRGADKGFKGSRIFSRANHYLSDLGEWPQIDWRLYDGERNKAEEG